MAYITAFMEAFTLENFPYYQHTDKWLMYKYGSAFYALYFIVSFPMFARQAPAPPGFVFRLFFRPFSRSLPNRAVMNNYVNP
jgi:cycloeucalenol cycloisomerase